MDYARFNYVAQPEDNVPPELSFRAVGPYDIWATHWGYAPIPGATTPEAEKATLDKWAREQDTVPYLRFTTAGQAGSDPGEETEAVGDQDATKATGWGIKNLKREMAWVLSATTNNKTENYDETSTLYGTLVGQWRTELTHVTNQIGAATSQDKYAGQAGVLFTPVGRARQVAAVKFLNENAFTTPTFFLDENILRRIEPTGSVQRISSAQSAILSSLLQNARLVRMQEYAASAKAGDAYTIPDLLTDVRHGLFSEEASGGTVDIYRRALQRVYVENLNAKLNPPPANAAAAGGRGGGGGRGGAAQLDPKLSDLYPAVRAELKALDGDLKAAEGKTKDGMTKAHIADLRHRIADALKGKAGAADEE